MKNTQIRIDGLNVAALFGSIIHNCDKIRHKLLLNYWMYNWKFMLDPFIAQSGFEMWKNGKYNYFAYFQRQKIVIH